MWESEIKTKSAGNFPPDKMDFSFDKKQTVGRTRSVHSGALMYS